MFIDLNRDAGRGCKSLNSLTIDLLKEFVQRHHICRQSQLQVLVVTINVAGDNRGVGNPMFLVKFVTDDPGNVVFAAT